ncbi:FBD-associated F-box protein At4g10400-like [Triticum dicoccoides]|uniref:FBD-associated F-box protein At4g10400-like n=1 Tax=Triticum dicoccoides TaxID=85692 RepID=UPI001891380F|nr:FBD-associated F-box protein At4g10400-like [Triticum dicoccoides]
MRPPFVRWIPYSTVVPDRLGALPDAVLQHVLSFLPSRDAVRTCLLARRWRHQWKSVPALRITGVDSFESCRDLNDFVNHLIILRDRTRLHACEIEAYSEYDGRGNYSADDGSERSRYTDLWTRYALSCQARLLRLGDRDPANRIAEHEWVQLSTSIASPHLTTLELDGVLLSIPSDLDFSACTNLQTIKMNRCTFQNTTDYGPVNISSTSMRYLSITDYSFMKHALVSGPSLVYLELADGHQFVPEFGSMPSLRTASIKLDHSFDRDGEDGSWLLGRLSDITNLALIAEPQMFPVFRKDFKWCTAFNKLKTLSVNDWCVKPDFRPLLYFLQQSPSLEKLCLQLFMPYQNAEGTNRSYDTTKPFLASKYLRDVKIKCHEKDERVHKIVKVLSSCGVPVEQIEIKINRHS